MFVLLLAFLAFVSLGLPDTVLGVAWPSIRSLYGLSQAGLGTILVGIGTGYFSSALFSGRLLDRLGLATMLVLSTLFVAVGLAFFSLALPWPVPLLFGALIGVGSGAIDAGINTFAAARFTARQVNWLHACYSLGTTIGPLVMTAAIARAWGWTTGYVVLAASLALMTLLFAVTRRAWTTPAENAKAPADAPAGAGGALAALRHPLVPVQTVIFFVYTGMEAGLGQWAFTVNTESRGVSVETAGLWTASFFGAILAGRVVLGAAVDRVGPDRMIRLCTLGLLAGAGLFALGWPRVGWAGLVLAGFSAAPIYPTLISRTAARLPPEVAIHAVGFKVSAAMLGAAMLPLGAGLLAELLGLEAVGWLLAGSALVLVGLHEWLLRLSRARGVV